jgi:two-component system chemotaxis response regulator CheY
MTKNNYKILIAEDNFVSRKLLNKQLAGLGEVDVASNGKEAITAVEMAINDHALYDMIFLDIMMPEINGLQALVKIRKLESQHGLDEKHTSKIIMTSAHSDKQVVENAIQANCNAYLIKPVTKERLYEEIEKLGFKLLN